MNRPYARLTALSLCCAALTFLAGCGSSALGFNEALVKANKKLESAGKAYGESLNTAITSNDATQARQKYEQVVATLKEVKAEVDGYPSEGIDGAKELKAAYDKFIQGQERMVNNEFKQLLQVVENKNLPANAKQQQLQGIALRVTQAEQGDLQALQAAQRTFAQKHNITLK